MSLKELLKHDDDKYIAVSDFVELIASHTSDNPDVVISYLARYTHFDGDFNIYLKYVNSGYINEWVLGDLLANATVYDDRICTFDELTNIEHFSNAFFLKSDVFNAEHIKALNLPLGQKKPVNFELGEYQKLLITYELFTPEKIACLLTDSNPAYNHNNDDYNARLDMVSNAIDAGKLNYVNDKDEISAEQIKIWLKNNKIIFEGFNDDLSYLSLEQSIQVSQLQKRIDELESQLSKFQTAAPDVVSIPFGKRIDLINKDLPQDERLKESYQIYSNDFSFHEDKHPVNTPDEMIERIQGLLKVIKRKDSKILELEQQTNAPAHAQAEIDELKEQLSKASAELAVAKTATTAQPIDWQSIGGNENIYPPELHLALMIWQRIYLDNELKNKHLNHHSDKFKVIANKMNLKPNSSLGKRVEMIINTARSKNEQASLADPLRAIEQLYMPAKKEKVTS